jgi:hypothetical protein
MDKSARWSAILRRMCLGIFLFGLWGAAGAGHAPIVFYNVANWYSGGWEQIRYQSPWDAYAVEWAANTLYCQTGAQQWVLKSVDMVHSDGYEDGTLYKATVTANHHDDCTFLWIQDYPSGARRYANCGGPGSSSYSPNAWPGGRCPDLKPNPDKNRGKPSVRSARLAIRSIRHRATSSNC